MSVNYWAIIMCSVFDREMKYSVHTVARVDPVPHHDGGGGGPNNFLLTIYFYCEKNSCM